MSKYLDNLSYFSLGTYYEHEKKSKEIKNCQLSVHIPALGKSIVINFSLNDFIPIISSDDSESLPIKLKNVYRRFLNKRHLRTLVANAIHQKVSDLNESYQWADKVLESWSNPELNYVSKCALDIFSKMSQITLEEGKKQVLGKMKEPLHAHDAQQEALHMGFLSHFISVEEYEDYLQESIRGAFTLISEHRALLDEMKESAQAIKEGLEGEGLSCEDAKNQLGDWLERYYKKGISEEVYEELESVKDLLSSLYPNENVKIYQFVNEKVLSPRICDLLQAFFKEGIESKECLDDAYLKKVVDFFWELHLVNEAQNGGEEGFLQLLIDEKKGILTHPLCQHTSSHSSASFCLVPFMSVFRLHNKESLLEFWQKIHRGPESTPEDDTFVLFASYLYEKMQAFQRGNEG